MAAHPPEGSRGGRQPDYPLQKIIDFIAEASGKTFSSGQVSSNIARRRPSVPTLGEPQDQGSIGGGHDLDVIPEFRRRRRCRRASVPMLDSKISITLLPVSVDDSFGQPAADSPAHVTDADLPEKRESSLRPCELASSYDGSQNGPHDAEDAESDGLGGQSSDVNGDVPGHDAAVDTDAADMASLGTYHSYHWIGNSSHYA
ncbi:hypothetical protein B0H14DRAFT_3613943 [Mycena olivaceomarginata]|nr:hypothetical protein B0H14DRAFT_3613943 [Mycena olivaceomarginata]